MRVTEPLGHFGCSTAGRRVQQTLIGSSILLTAADCRRAGNTSADGADNYAEATLRMSLQGNKLTVLDYFRPADYAYLDTCDPKPYLTCAALDMKPLLRFTGFRALPLST